MVSGECSVFCSLISYRKKCILKISASEVSFFSISGTSPLITIKKRIFCCREWFTLNSFCLPFSVNVFVDRTLCLNWHHSFKCNDFALFSVFPGTLIGAAHALLWGEQSVHLHGFCTQMQAAASEVNGKCWKSLQFLHFSPPCNYAVTGRLKISLRISHCEQKILPLMEVGHLQN